MDEFIEFLQHGWAASQICAEQNLREMNEKQAAYYAGRASAFRETIYKTGNQTNEDIYQDKKIALKLLLDKNQVRGK
jgi:hypothetical protein